MLIDPQWPLGWILLLFGVGAAMILLGGTRMAGLADRLADRTGLGEAIMGGLFLGLSTSLPGITASVTAAVDGFAELAVSNAMGGIAVQTAFLAIADLFHRRANLEHAAASVPNLLQSAVLITLLALVAVFILGPEVTVAHVHPGTAVLIVVYLLGLRLVFSSSAHPLWRPRLTAETIQDRPDRQTQQESLVKLWLGFGLAAAIVLLAGILVARAGEALVLATGLSASVVGGLILAISTSLPELVTTIAAVRRGALTLAVSDIVGGNAFDILFVCIADAAYLEGSIYHAIGHRELFIVALAILVNVILLLGLLQRQKRGFANIGFESILILIIYAGGFLALSLGQ